MPVIHVLSKCQVQMAQCRYPILGLQPSLKKQHSLGTKEVSLHLRQILIILFLNLNTPSRLDNSVTEMDTSGREKVTEISLLNFVVNAHFILFPN